ncbi:hypothetical protein Bca4012_063034 [Brassica carinata]
MNVVAVEEDKKEVLQPSLDALYQMVWSLDTSPKIKHFMWHCLNNALPVAENMVRRHIGKDNRCYRCDSTAESVNHLLFQCTYARLIWAEANIHIPPSEYPLEMLEDGLVPWLLWRIWKNRNELLFRNKDYLPLVSVAKARTDNQEWKSRSEVEKVEVKAPTTLEPEHNWHPPPPLSVKCNTDGSWKQEINEGGVGWILRNHEGCLLWAGANKLTDMGSALETEAEALRWAIFTLKGFGYQNVIFETDSQGLVKLLTGEEELWPKMKPIIQEIKVLLSGGAEMGVVFHPRSGNKVADRIARETSSFTSFVPKLYSMVPSWLSFLIEADKHCV